jgi:hypothetical protein
LKRAFFVGAVSQARNLSVLADRAVWGLWLKVGGTSMASITMFADRAVVAGERTASETAPTSTIHHTLCSPLLLLSSGALTVIGSSQAEPEQTIMSCSSGTHWVHSHRLSL